MAAVTVTPAPGTVQTLQLWFVELHEKPQQQACSLTLSSHPVYRENGSWVMEATSLSRDLCLEQLAEVPSRAQRIRGFVHGQLQQKEARNSFLSRGEGE